MDSLYGQIAAELNTFADMVEESGGAIACRGYYTKELLIRRAGRKLPMPRDVRHCTRTDF